jgi:hypothetical protein
MSTDSQKTGKTPIAYPYSLNPMNLIQIVKTDGGLNATIRLPL